MSVPKYVTVALTSAEEILCRIRARLADGLAAKATRPAIFCSVT